MSFISSSVLRLRAVEPDDVDRLYLWENDRSQSDVSPTGGPVSRYMLWEYAQNYNADPLVSGGVKYIITDNSGVAIGIIDLYDTDTLNRRSGVGIYITPESRHAGYATEALHLICEYAADTLGLHQLWAHIAVDNEASRRLFLNAGFKATGRLRSWVRRGKSYADVLVFQRLL